MKRIMLWAVLAAATVSFAKEADENMLRQRNASRREITELEKRRNALKESIRAQLEAAETLTITAELMEGARKFPPVERERQSEIRAFEAGVSKTVEKAAGDKSNCVHRWMTLDEGRRYRFRAEVRAEDVKGADIKFGLMVPRPSGSSDWPSASVGSGSFEWRLVSFDYLMPSGSSSVLLLYGLEGGSGKVEFRDVTVSELSRTLE